ncbi:uncharacterized protein FIBRA_00594 [Fibroporia radiculosa]|uniref:Uncharacterized protein n=1 Tax=Fibroporia radiculosa TaxID=599839 RepID=J4HRV2_9APHY|nr:uncharacterized protein FIBRA_00594 [Fibroporia radiculosa]CCL98592.1 predicted protein [Fibroporia radiculosa]
MNLSRFLLVAEGGGPQRTALSVAGHSASEASPKAIKIAARMRFLQTPQRHSPVPLHKPSPPMSAPYSDSTHWSSSGFNQPDPSAPSHPSAASADDIFADVIDPATQRAVTQATSHFDIGMSAKVLSYACQSTVGHDQCVQFYEMLWDYHGPAFYKMMMGSVGAVAQWEPAYESPLWYAIQLDPRAARQAGEQACARVGVSFPSHVVFPPMANEFVRISLTEKLLALNVPNMSSPADFYAFGAPSQVGYQPSITFNMFSDSSSYASNSMAMPQSLDWTSISMQQPARLPAQPAESSLPVLSGMSQVNSVAPVAAPCDPVASSFGETLASTGTSREHSAFNLGEAIGPKPMMSNTSASGKVMSTLSSLAERCSHPAQKREREATSPESLDEAPLRRSKRIAARCTSSTASNF